MKMQRLGGGCYQVNGWKVVQIDSTFVVEDTGEELDVVGLDTLPHKNPWAAPVAKTAPKAVKAPKAAPKVAPLARGFLNRQPLSLEVERLQAAYRKVERLATKRGDSFCFSCGRLNPAIHPTGGTACCQDDLASSKHEVLENLQDSIEFLQ